MIQAEQRRPLSESLRHPQDDWAKPDPRAHLGIDCAVEVRRVASRKLLGRYHGARLRPNAPSLEVAARMAEFSPYGLEMTKDVIWANLENTSLEAAIEFEDRNQLMMGFTENLPEAIRAFDQGRDPVYTDEPRRDIFG